jgi:parvulin-like peptidyl-prolyl isomerase
MEQKLDFSLPGKEEKKAASQSLLIVLLIAAVALSGAGLYVAAKNRTSAQAGSGAFTAEQMKDLAGKLASRGLYDRAVAVWKDYLKGAPLTGVDQAKALFHVAGLLADAGKYDEAVEYYYRSGTAAKVPELEQQMNTKLKDCYEKMGKFAALEREIAARTGMSGQTKTDDVVVAEIGTEKITAQKLDEMIEQQIEMQISAWGRSADPEQLRERKKEMVKRYTGPAERQRFLEGWLSQELLYRDAVEKRLLERPAVKAIIEKIAKELIAAEAMKEATAGKDTVTETDVKAYYEANKSKYVLPVKAKISHIAVGTEATGLELLTKLKGGADFALLTKEYSQDSSTKDKGGKIDDEILKGEYVGGIGQSKDLNEKIFAMKGPGLIGEPVKVDKQWEVVRVDELTPERQQGLEEVYDPAMHMVEHEKQEASQQAYVKSLMDKFNVVVHTSTFGKKEEGKSK